ncbi:MAG: hypothetical protein ABUL62_02800 [Myxococcales bacterium]
MLPELSPTPARPSHVSALAEWFFDSGEWVLCARDAQGELHGSLRAHRGDGTPSLEFEYRHGKRHGPFRRFYASGQLAQSGRYLDDAPDGLLCVYSDGESACTIRECCIVDAARVMKQEYRRGQLLAESFYDAQGALLRDPEGAFGAPGWPQPLREREADAASLEYAFWPANEVLPEVTSDEPVVVEQSLVALRAAIRRAALRVQMFRSESIAKGAKQAPPDVSALAAGAPPLRQFTFRASDAAEPAVVQVDETLSPKHAEWTLLCTLCWAAGSSSVELPERIAPRPELYAALVHATRRIAALSGHELEPDRGPHFHGLDETRLPATALEQLAEHYREIRAALLFATDPECQSPWQDDLGRLGSPSEP